MSNPPDKSSFARTWAGGLVLLLALGAVGILNYVRPPGRRISPKNVCISNLKQVDGAVQRWALEASKTAMDTYSLTDTNLLSYLPDSVLPRCPLGGSYTAGTNVTDSPRCNVPGHTL